MSVKRSTRPRPELVAAFALAAAPFPTLAERVESARRQGSCQAALRELGLHRAEASACRHFEALADSGFDALCLTDPEYPRLLRASWDPPLLLSLWGRLEIRDALSIAVVGSRRASRYGLEMSRYLASGLARRGLTIVSGLARGIDAAAHRGALEAGGRTVAVLGSGLSHIYPREHRELAARIAASGAVLSELELHAPPRPGNFPKRNRIITGMTLGTLVVEAAERSGSLVSARLALEQDRDVFAVPGLARSRNSAGVHALIRDGATLVTEPEDVVAQLRPEIQDLLSDPCRQTEDTAAPAPELRPIELAILGELTMPLDADAIVERLDLPIHEVLAALGRLELGGRIWSLPGGLYQARPATSEPPKKAPFRPRSGRGW